MTPSHVEQAEREVRFDRLILTRFAAAVRDFASSDEGQSRVSTDQVAGLTSPMKKASYTRPTRAITQSS